MDALSFLNLKKPHSNPDTQTSQQRAFPIRHLPLPQPSIMCLLILTRYDNCLQRRPHISFDKCRDPVCEYDDFSCVYGPYRYPQPTRRLILLSESVAECPKCREIREKSIANKLYKLLAFEAKKEEEAEEGKGDGKGQGGWMTRLWGLRKVFGRKDAEKEVEMEELAAMMDKEENVTWI